MTPEQSAQLATMLSEKRTQLRLSINEVARRAHLDTVAVWRIEQAKVASPRAENLLSIARVLGINPVELFLTSAWLTADDLLDFNAYLDSKTNGQTRGHSVQAYRNTQRRNSYEQVRVPTAEHCPQRNDHCPQCPCAPKEY